MTYKDAEEVRLLGITKGGPEGELGNFNLAHVFADGLGPFIKGPSVQLMDQVEDPPVQRVFELLHRSVGSQLIEGSSPTREEQWRSTTSHRLTEQRTSPETGPSRCQSEPNLTEGKNEARPPPVLSSMLILRSVIRDEEGEWLGHNVDFGMGMKCGATAS